MNDSMVEFKVLLCYFQYTTNIIVSWKRFDKCMRKPYNFLVMDVED